jgi:hypothetical protein
MRLIVLTMTAGLGLAACNAPPSQPQDSNLVNATLSDQAYPSTAQGNDIVTGAQPSGGGAAPPTNAAGAAANEAAPAQ